MKKNNTVKQSLEKGPKKTTKGAPESITIGMDLGDKASRYCVLDGTGEVKEEGSVPTSKKGMMQMCSLAWRAWTRSSYDRSGTVANKRSCTC